MEKEKVRRDNALFIITVVGLSFGSEYFAQAVSNSSMEISQFPTDNVGSLGYIRIDSSGVRRKGEDYWFEFVDKIRDGLLARCSYEFSSATEFEGDIADQTAFKKEGYIFSFHIKQYERDNLHDFEIVGPGTLSEIPEGEKLGRVVFLTIEPEK